MQPEFDVPALQDALAAGAFSAVELVQHCLARIAADDARVHAVLALDPSAADQAAAADARRRAGTVRGPLDGIPVLVKDNVATTGLPTTAGSRALAASRPADAPLVTRLREAGAVVLGKTNLSEWANFRSTRSTSGWSAVGGQTRNPHVLDRTTSGSSSGSAAAIAAGFAPLAVGTETDGSIVSPAGVCGVVGLKPTLGTVPGAGIVPISAHQDTAGPLARHVVDAAILKAVLTGGALPRLRGADDLRGARLGVWLPTGADDALRAVLDGAVAALAEAGATAVAVDLDPAGVEADEWPALVAEFRAEIDAYLAAAPGAAVRSLAELVEFNRGDDVELSAFGQEIFEEALAAPPIDDADYRRHRHAATTAARALLDEPLGRHGLDAIITLSNDPAWRIDVARGDDYRVSTSTPAAVAGYPTVSVPAGFLGGLPVGLSLVAPAGRDDALLKLAAGVEQVTRARRDPAYLACAD